MFFGKREIRCPIDQENRIWMENAFLRLAGQFNHVDVFKLPMLLPTQEKFPYPFDGSTESLARTGRIVADQMGIDFNEIRLEIYADQKTKSRSDFGYELSTRPQEGEKLAGGLYFGRADDGRYDVFVERDILFDPESLVAVIAHEFAHILLLGQGRLKGNDESATDLATVVLGLGIFNANCSYKEYNGVSYSAYRKLGYLKQQQWGYALALYAYYREEKQADWKRHLTGNIKEDFARSMEYIQANPDKIFKEKIKTDE